MADQDQYQDGDGQEQTPQRRQYQQFPQRSTASLNWRSKDDSPRAEPQARTRQPRAGGYGSSQQSYDRREQSDTRLYVGNLLYSASKDDIMQFFANNGLNPSNLTMSIDPETGRNPSYCFADFETADEASRAINDLNGADLLGRAVKISPGVARKQGDQAGTPRQYNSPRGWGQDRPDNARSPGSYNQSQSPYNNRNQDQESQGPVKKLYIGGLPDLGEQSEVEKSIKSLFDQVGIELVYVSKLIAPHESKASEPGDHYYCFVEVAKPEDAELAIENLDQKGSPWAGEGEGLLRVNKAREQNRGPRQGGFGQGGFRDRKDRTDGFKDWRTTRAPAAQ